MSREERDETGKRRGAAKDYRELAGMRSKNQDGDQPLKGKSENLSQSEIDTKTQSDTKSESKKKGRTVSKGARKVSSAGGKGVASSAQGSDEGHKSTGHSVHTEWSELNKQVDKSLAQDAMCVYQDKRSRAGLAVYAEDEPLNTMDLADERVYQEQKQALQESMEDIQRRQLHLQRQQELLHDRDKVRRQRIEAEFQQKSLELQE